jgi:glycosyltransferase involved in cell wall biosynthesis
MKLNLIIPSFYPAVVYGGPIFSTFNTCKELAKFKDLEIYVSTTNTNMYSKLDVETNKWIKLENFYVKYYNETIIDKFSFSLYTNIHKDIKKSDIIHIQAIFNTPTPLSLFWSRFYKKPTILSPRGSLGDWVMNHGNKLKKKWLEIFIKPFANYVIWHATSEQEKKEILNHFPKVKVKIIPNGIYVDEFKNFNKLEKKDYIKKYTTQDKVNINKIIISMGRLQKKKGFDILINSFYNVLKIYPNSYLLIAGPDEGEKDKLKNQIKQLSLEKNVFLVGNLQGQDKIDFLANADLFALPSHNENFGNVYVESLASGTPIVASKNTPWKDVEKYNCGKWVENSVEKTSEAIIEILEKDREEMRKNSQQFAIRYDWKNIAKQFKQLFDDLINKKK